MSPGTNQAKKADAAINSKSVSGGVYTAAILLTQHKTPPKIIGLNFMIPPEMNVGIPYIIKNNDVV